MLKENKGITLIALIITIIVLIILMAIGIKAGRDAIRSSKDNRLVTELDMVQHAVFERNAKYKLINDQSVLAGTRIPYSEVKVTADKMNVVLPQELTFYSLNKDDLKNLGLEESEYEYIVNYANGIVMNKTITETNAGEALYKDVGAIIVGDGEPKLPNGYQKVEYIKSTGTQYIDTEVIPNSNTGFYLDFTLLDAIDTNGKRLLGSSKRNGGYWGGIIISSWNATVGGQIGYLKKSDWYNPGLISNTRMQLELINRHYQTSTGANITFQSESSADIYGSLYILNINTDDLNLNCTSAMLYSARIYDGNSIIRNFIPCYQKSGRTVGLYDTVEGKFYTNKGTGIFEKGSDIFK